MSADVWTHIGFARLGALLGERAGLRFAPNRQPAAEGAMRRVMRELKLGDPLQLARRVEHDAAALDALLAESTIGETYFFREPSQLAYIRREVLPSFRGRRSAERPLRAWSAGCASGEEAYTLAILLREGGWTGAARVLGTDISRPRLLAAERARYTRWSMRGVPAESIARYFVNRGPSFFLRAELRAMADFRPLNLAADDYPGAASGIGEMDLVLCRNVLIYFDRETVAAVARRLLASLSEEGWLFLGASDPMLAELVPCETVVTGAGLAYRRLDVALPRPRVWLRSEAPEAPQAAEPTPPAEPPDTPVAPPLPAPRAPVSEPATIKAHEGGDVDALADAQTLYAARDYAGAAERARTIVQHDARGVGAWALLVRALANAGREADAEQACAAALEQHRDSAELAYLHAVLLAHDGHFAASAAAARRALYLDRTLAVAHLALGAALAREGHRPQARRAYESAERLLATYAPDAPVPLADGEPARRLLEAARAQQRHLGQAVA